MAEDAKVTIGIISLGDMGSGLARLLVAHGYPVTTNISGRRHVPTTNPPKTLTYNPPAKTLSLAPKTPAQPSSPQTKPSSPPAT